MDLIQNYTSDSDSQEEEEEGLVSAHTLKRIGGATSVAISTITDTTSYSNIPATIPKHALGVESVGNIYIDAVDSFSYGPISARKSRELCRLTNSCIVTELQICCTK